MPEACAWTLGLRGALSRLGGAPGLSGSVQARPVPTPLPCPHPRPSSVHDLWLRATGPPHPQPRPPLAAVREDRGRGCSPWSSPHQKGQGMPCKCSGPWPLGRLALRALLQISPGAQRTKLQWPCGDGLFCAFLPFPCPGPPGSMSQPSASLIRVLLWGRKTVPATHSAPAPRPGISPPGARVPFSESRWGFSLPPAHLPTCPPAWLVSSAGLV